MRRGRTGWAADMQRLESAKQLFFDGISHFQNGRFGDAETAFRSSLELVPDRPSTLVNLAATELQLGKAAMAAETAARALFLDPGNADAWYRNGTALDALDDQDGALASFRKAVELNPDHADARLNIGAVLADLGKVDEALLEYDRILAHRPDYAEAWSNKAVALAKLSRLEEALAHYQRALTLRPDHAPTLANMGVALNQLRRHEEALTHLERAAGLRPDHDFLLGQFAFTKMVLGDWAGLDTLLAQIRRGIEAGKKVAAPFWCLTMFDSPALHLAAAKIWLEPKAPARSPAPAPSARRNPAADRIRVGYISADFGQHPVGVVAAELFELHDRSRFEIHAFSLRDAHPNDRLRPRLEAGFDFFHDAKAATDPDVAALAREIGLDIAVDLGGHTEHSRTGIFAHRAAPIQIGFLGYPATTGATYMDYIVADTTVLPESARAAYTEAPIYLPDTFMPDDSTRQIAANVPTRAEAGLPERGFVYCCFNSGFKIGPEIVSIWARILRGVEDSVLWLPAGSRIFNRNLAAAFASHSVSPDRIRFAQRTPSPEDHLARLSLADLFLDTLPYNAHSTTVDALRVGLPVLTCVGEAFAGRVAASLLGAVGLSELSTRDLAAYEALAIALPGNPDRLRAIRTRLIESRTTAPLFNTRDFARHLEDGYAQAVARKRADLPPTTIYVRRSTGSP